MYRPIGTSSNTYSPFAFVRVRQTKLCALTVGGKRASSFLFNGPSFEHVGDGRLVSVDEARKSNTSMESNGDD
jgi:hypothetical protein